MILLVLFVLNGTEQKTQIYHYLLPITVGVLFGYIIGKYKDKWEKRSKEFNEIKEKNKELLKTNKNLNKNVGYFNALMNNSPAVIYLKNITGKYIAVNDSFIKLFGISNKEILKKDDSFLFSKKKSAQTKKSEKRIIKTNSQIIFDEEIKKDGIIQKFLTIKFPLKNEKYRIIGIAGISFDITEYRKEDEKFKHSQNIAEIEVLAEKILHNFNNELSGIMGAVSLIKFKNNKGDLSKAKLDEYIEILESSTRKASNVVRKLKEIPKEMN